MSDWERRVLGAIDPDELVRLTGELVRFASVTPPGSEEAVARYLAKRFAAKGLRAELQELSPGRLNAIGRLGRGGARPHLVLNGHTDVVPTGEGWSSPPFEPTLRDGRMYGRGAADMKGGLAAAIVAVEAIAAAGAPLAGAVTIAAVADEEGYQGGTRLYVERGEPADFGIVAEPTSLRPATAQKGDTYWEVAVRGVSAHASAPHTGRNAIYDMAAAVGALEELHAEYLARPPHPLLGTPTLSVGTIVGGTVTPVVAEACRITIDRRILPGEDVEAVGRELEGALERARQRRPGLEATLRRLAHFPASEIAADEPIVRALQEASYHIRGAAPAPLGLAGTTDANIMIDPGGIPTAIFGPGDLSVCHKPDEFLLLDELVDAARIFALTILRLVGEGTGGV